MYYAKFNIDTKKCLYVYSFYGADITDDMRALTEEQYQAALLNQNALVLNDEGNVRLRTQQELDDDAIAEQAAQDAIRDERRRTDLLVIDFVNDPTRASDDARAEVARRLGVVS